MSISSRTNRKILINPHTGLANNKPVGILNLGEIGVEHSGVDSAKLYVETNSASTNPNTIATFITENETKGYVESRISGVTEIINDLLDIVLTGGTGDTIIDVTINGTSADTNPNTFTVTHKAGSAQSGFKKLATDAYGHVTAGTDVTIEDVSGLSGFTEVIEEIAVSGVTEERERAIAAEQALDNKIGGVAETVVSAFTINGATKYGSNNSVDLGNFLSGDTSYIKSISETTEQGTGNRILTFTDSQNQTTEIVETIIIDCGEY